MQWLNSHPNYMGVLSQYFDGHGPIGREVDLSVVTDTRSAFPANVSEASIEAEVYWAITTQPGWAPAGIEDQYMVVVPPKATYSFILKGCGFHGWSQQLGTTFQFIRYPAGDWHGCLDAFFPAGTPQYAALQVTAIHEAVETATNPIPDSELGGVFTGWANGAEASVVDMCLTSSSGIEVEPGMWVERLFDNYLRAASGQTCVVQDAAPARYEATTGAVTSVSAATHSAVLNGTVTPAGYPANYWFSQGSFRWRHRPRLEVASDPCP